VIGVEIGLDPNVVAISFDLLEGDAALTDQLCREVGHGQSGS